MLSKTPIVDLTDSRPNRAERREYRLPYTHMSKGSQSRHFNCCIYSRKPSVIYTKRRYILDERSRPGRRAIITTSLHDDCTGHALGRIRTTRDLRCEYQATWPRSTTMRRRSLTGSTPKPRQFHQFTQREVSKKTTLTSTMILKSWATLRQSSSS